MIEKPPYEPPRLRIDVEPGADLTPLSDDDWVPTEQDIEAGKRLIEQVGAERPLEQGAQEEA